MIDEKIRELHSLLDKNPDAVSRLALLEELALLTREYNSYKDYLAVNQ
jgi:hypothetical protein